MEIKNEKQYLNMEYKNKPYFPKKPVYLRH